VAFGPHPITQNTDDCTSTVNSTYITLIKMVAAWSFIALTFWFIVFAIIILSSSSKSAAKMEKYISKWQQWLEFCCIQGMGHKLDSKEVLKDIARELGTFFHDVDWAPSDLLVAVILLKREQKKITEIRQARRLIVEQPQGFSIPVVDSKEALHELETVVKNEGKIRISPLSKLDFKKLDSPLVTPSNLEPISENVVSKDSTDDSSRMVSLAAEMNQIVQNSSVNQTDIDSERHTSIDIEKIPQSSVNTSHQIDVLDNNTYGLGILNSNTPPNNTNNNEMSGSQSIIAKEKPEIGMAGSTQNNSNPDENGEQIYAAPEAAGKSVINNNNYNIDTKDNPKPLIISTNNPNNKPSNDIPKPGLHIDTNVDKIEVTVTECESPEVRGKQSFQKGDSTELLENRKSSLFSPVSALMKVNIKSVAKSRKSDVNLKDPSKEMKSPTSKFKRKVFTNIQPIIFSNCIISVVFS
jgi:hypothetical protein